MIKFKRLEDYENTWTYGNPKDPMYVEAEIDRKRLIVRMWENGQQEATTSLPMDPEGPSYRWSQLRELKARFAFLDLFRELPSEMDPFKESLAQWQQLVTINKYCEHLVNAIKTTALQKPNLLFLIAGILKSIFDQVGLKDALDEVLKAPTKKLREVLKEKSA